MKLPIQRLALAGLTLLSSVAMAYQPAYEDRLPDTAPRMVLTGGISFGGDDLATVKYKHGKDNLEAGGGLYLGAGIEFPMIPHQMALRTSVGYQFDSVDADNGKASFDRVPWDVLVLLGASPYRLGIGATYHTDTHYEYRDSYGTNIDADFDDALGLVLALEMELAPTFSMTLRYTDIEYDQSNPLPGQQAKTIDGSGAGITANFNF